MSKMLENKTLVVTGGSSGIGRGIALTAGQHGAKAVIIGDLEEIPKEGGATTISILEKMGVSSRFYKTNVTKESDVAALVESGNEFGGIDVMVCNAGIALPEDNVDLTVEDFQRLIDVNLKGVFLSAQLAARQMRDDAKKGSIIAISSMGGIRGSQGTVGYSTTKGGVNLMVASLADALGPYGIRINAVCPGLIKTALIDSSPHVAAMVSGMLERMPLRRLANVAEVGEAVCWLGSDYASFVTGIAMPVDGGMLAVI